jgi:hypothetical protein
MVGGKVRLVSNINCFEMLKFDNVTLMMLFCCSSFLISVLDICVIWSNLNSHNRIN